MNAVSPAVYTRYTPHLSDKHLIIDAASWSNPWEISPISAHVWDAHGVGTLQFRSQLAAGASLGGEGQLL